MSRPLLRSRWAWIAREHIRKHTRLFSSSIPRSQGATISFRRSHSFADPNSPSTSPRPFPIDVIDHQTHVQNFNSALEAGELEKAREILLDLVDRHRADSNMDVFRQLRAVIAHYAEPNVGLLLELGLSLASKGYTDFVKDEIAPAIEDYGTGQTFSRFQAILETLEKTRPKPKATPLVFEEASEDYANVLSRFPLPPPSIMELIQQQLSPMLPESANDQSVFEEESEEYSLYRPSGAEEYPENPSADILLDLVKAQHFERAYDLLNEMQNINAPIPPSDLYEVAALNVLRNPDLLPTEKLDQFTKWMSLFPPYHTIKPCPDFAEIRYHLLQSPITHLELIKRCALVLASKGYADNRLKKFLPPIFTFLPPTEVMDFILELERRTLDYWLNRSPVKALVRNRVASENIRAIALRSLSYRGHVELAMALIRDKSTPILPISAYDVLLKKLSTSPTLRYREYIPIVDSLRDQRLEINKARGREVPSSLQPSVPPAALDTALPPPTDPEDLSSMLRYLRKAILFDDTHRILPSLLSDFMAAYLKSGRIFAIHLLLAKALRKGYRAPKLFLFAEMRLYRRFQQYDLLIKTFMQHFYLVGVPREEVKAWYNKLQLREAEGKGENLERISGFNSGTLLMDGRLWPDLEQCDLVWEALIIAAKENEEGLMNLYKKFIYYARHADDASSDPSLASVAPLPMLTRFELPVSGLTFHTFMHHMLPVFGPDFGYKILADMWSLDLWPGKFHYGTLARHYAEEGNLEQVFAIIDMLEKGTVLAHRPERTDMGSRPRRGDGAQLAEGNGAKVPLFMQPDAPFYINIMQGLTYSKNVEAAKEVYHRLQRRCPCPPGTYPPLDRALQKLADLQVLLGSVSPAQQIVEPSLSVS